MLKIKEADEEKISPWDSPEELKEQALQPEIEPIDIPDSGTINKKPIAQKESIIEVSKTEPKIDEEEEDSEGEWESEESESESFDNMRYAKDKPFNPIKDRMINIDSEPSDIILMKSLDNFDPRNEVSASMKSSDFDVPFVMPNQLEVTQEDQASFTEIYANLKEQQMAAKGMININKKLPPKIPIDKIIRKNKKDMPSIKGYTDGSLKSGSTDSLRKHTPSTEQRLSGGKDDQLNEDNDEDDDMIDPFTNEQKKVMQDIMNFEKEGEVQPQDTKPLNLDKKGKQSSITKTTKQKTEDVSELEESKDEIRRKIRELEEEYEAIDKGKKRNKKSRKTTTMSSSELSDTTLNNGKKSKKVDETWDNQGFKFVKTNDKNDNPNLPNFRRQPFTDNEIQEAFKVFDLNRNGFIGNAEVRFIVDHLGNLINLHNLNYNIDEDVADEEIDEMVRMLDHDGDGQVNFKEFYRMATGLMLPPIGAEMPNPFDDDEPIPEKLQMITAPYKAQDEFSKPSKPFTSKPVPLPKILPNFPIPSIKKPIMNPLGKTHKSKKESSKMSSDSSSSEDTINRAKKRFGKAIHL